MLEEKYSLPEHFKKVKVAQTRLERRKKNQDVADEEAEIIDTGNGGMSGGKHFLGTGELKTVLALLSFFFSFLLHRMACDLTFQAEINLCSLQWKHRVLTNGPPGEVQCQLSRLILTDARKC